MFFVSSIVAFFDRIQPSLPVLQDQPFMSQASEGLADEMLTVTICCISAKLLRSPWIGSASDLDGFLQILMDLNASALQLSHSMSLEMFQAACLLCYYEFHQHPGEQSWMKIGQLTRKAYQIGLNRLDNAQKTSISSKIDPGFAEKIGEWRNIWWCVYFLDSYSNITAGTPFIIENESLSTALVVGGLENYETSDTSPKKIFLPSTTAKLWKTVREAVASSQGYLSTFTMHVVSTCLIREAGTIFRLSWQNPTMSAEHRQKAFIDDFAAFKLALPSDYLNPARNLSAEETETGHQARLICNLHIHAAGLLVHSCATETRTNPTHILESCHDIVKVFQQWNNQFCLSVDPAISFIAFLALINLECLNGSVERLPNPDVDLTSSKNILILFMQQLEPYWHITRFLLGKSYENKEFLVVLNDGTDSHATLSRLTQNFKSISSIDRAIRRLLAPLNQEWIAFMALPDEHQSEIFRKAELSQEWDYSDWEAVTASLTSSSHFRLF
jgi:predicted Rdx family selenoprotein